MKSIPNNAYFLFMLFVSLSLPITPCSWAADAEEPLSQPADLTEMPLQELMEVRVTSVYGASKYEQKTTEAPASVTVITSEEIARLGYRTLADILRGTRSFFVSYDRNYSYIGLRGFNRPGDYNTRILLLVDGHRINDNIYEQAPIGTEFPLDMDLIERVEIIRGPASSLYGTSAFLGVINVITREGKGVNGVEVSGAAGSFDTYNGRITYGGKYDSGLQVLLSGSLYDSHGQSLYYPEFASPGSNNGIAENVDGDGSYSAFSKISFHDFTLEGAFSSRKKTIPTGSYGTVFNDPGNATTDSHGYADLRFEREMGNQTRISSRLYYDSYRYKGDYIYDRANPGDTPFLVDNHDTAEGRWWGGELQLTKTLLESHKVTAGAEYRGNLRQDQSNNDQAPFSSYLDDHRNSRFWAVFLQDEFRVRDDLILNMGARYDRYDIFGGTLSPRVALIYNPFDKTFLKLIYGEAFRAPNAYELYYGDNGNTMKANPGLHPEKIRTYEAVYEQLLGDCLRATVTGFYYRINDLISQQVDPADGLLVFRNMDRVEAKGAEVELEGKSPEGVEGKISYSYQRTKNLDSGERLSNSPLHLAKGNLIVPVFRDRLFSGVELLYTGSRKTIAGGTVSDYVVANLTLLSRKVVNGLEISASIYNLFDRKYSDPGGAELLQPSIEQDGRTFRVKITYRF